MKCVLIESPYGSRDRREESPVRARLHEALLRLRIRIVQRDTLKITIEES